MYDKCLSSRKVLIANIRASRPTSSSLIIGLAIILASILATVIDKEIVKIEVSFLI